MAAQTDGEGGTGGGGRQPKKARNENRKRARFKKYNKKDKSKIWKTDMS